MPTNNCVFNCLYMTCEEDIHRANMIRELLQARDGQLYISMSPCEVRTLLELAGVPVGGKSSVCLICMI